MALSLHVERILDVTVMELCGRVTLGEGSAVLRNAVREAVWNGHRKFALDYGDINYQDSSGNGEIVSAYTVVRNAGGELVLYSLTRKMRDLLQVTRLYTIFDVFDTRDDALKYFDGGRIWDVRVSAHRHMHISILEIEGALTERHGAAEVVAATRTALGSGAESVILVCPQVLEVDRFGAEKLLAAQRLVREGRGYVVLAGVENRLLSPLIEAGIPDALNMYGTVNEALGSFGLKALWESGRIEVVHED